MFWYHHCFFFLHLTTNIKYNLATDKTKQLSD